MAKSINPIHLRARRDWHVGFANITLRELLLYLFTTYGRLTPQDMMKNQRFLNTPWDPTAPLETLIDQIEKATEITDASNQPLSAKQVLRTAYTLVFNSGMYFDECKTWNSKTNDTKSWTTFKYHFLEAQLSLRLQQQTTQHAGFTPILYVSKTSHQNNKPQRQHLPT